MTMKSHGLGFFQVVCLAVLYEALTPEFHRLGVQVIAAAARQGDGLVRERSQQPGPAPAE